MESSELLVPNPLLYDDNLEKYIWISDLDEDHRNAQYLFGYLMRKNIYINGFVTNSSDKAELKMYNKKVYNLDSLQQENTVVFYDIWFRDIWKAYKDRGQRARIINPDLDQENIVIWGSGITGAKVFRLLAEAGIKVHFFVDSDKSLVGTVKCGIPVCSPDVLEENSTIIEAMEKWQQLDEEISARHLKRFHFSLSTIWDQISCNIDGIEKSVFNLSYFWTCNRFEGKRIYVYGFGDVEKSFANCLNLLDYEFGGFLVDNRKEIENDDCQIRNVEEIVYEHNYFVWIYDRHKNQKLRELGLRYYIDYECAVREYGIATDAKCCLDVNLGQSYLTESKYPGIIVYGTENHSDYKIAVLGGSTTDGAAFPFQSWSRILYEKLVYTWGGGVCLQWRSKRIFIRTGTD